VKSGPELIRQGIEKAKRNFGKTQEEIARDSCLSRHYVKALAQGRRARASRDALILLGAWGLELSIAEVDELLVAMDFKPLTLKRKRK
jgi:transcriptional regulator with XRE-family HTH domain